MSRTPTPADRAAADLAVAVPALHRALDHRIRADFPHDKLPDGQLALLRLVAEHEGVTVREAAEALLMKPNNVSALVSQLTGHALLERRSDPADRRVAHLHCTDLARERLAEADALAERHLAAAMRHLGEGEKAALGSALGALRSLTAHLRPTTGQD
ncbi:MarR family winged helix-turn-helix transcriptional regulator [Streptomyces sp. NPDC018610]|uniref:MarR family winged helix-turn-helix transcriptional regulator n=1 Tax=Streptomyces sp. NPDC018610 TaxID=3365049 RepID=UPI0037A85F75